MNRAKHNRQADIRRVAKILRDGGYTYDQSKHLIEGARKAVGLTPPKRKRGSVARLTQDEFEAFLNTAYSKSGVHGLLIRTLLETGSRVLRRTRNPNHRQGRQDARLCRSSEVSPMN